MTKLDVALHAGPLKKDSQVLSKFIIMSSCKDKYILKKIYRKRSGKWKCCLEYCLHQAIKNARTLRWS